MAPTRFRFEGPVVGEDGCHNTLFTDAEGQIRTCYRGCFSFGLHCIVCPD